MMSLSAHSLDNCPIRAIQVDENVTGVSIPGEGLNIDIASFPISSAQKSNRGRVRQLRCGPKSFTGKRTPSLAVNQTDQIHVVGHCCQLTANGLLSNKETAVFHDRHLAIETNGRTMDFQRTANSVLTVCLSPGGKSNRAV